MDLQEFASGVQFRFPSSEQSAPWRQLFLLASPRFAPRTRYVLESLSTSLPEDGARLRARLSRLANIPRMSTYAIASIVNKSVREMNPEAMYVNVGVWNGFTFLAGLVGNPHRRAIGVDNFSAFGGPRDAFLRRFRALASPSHQFFDGDFRTYFRDVHRGPIGVYYFDGPHDYASQREALELAEPFLEKGSVALVDDTNRPDPRRATLDFLAAQQGRYRLIFDRHSLWAENPLWWDGLMILRKES